MGQDESRAAGTDAQLCALAQAGDLRAADTLVRRWERYVYKVAGEFTTPLSSREDMHQEALIGFYGAVRYFKPDGGQSFPTFVRMCVLRWLYTIIKRDTTKGRYRPGDIPLSLDAALDGDEDLTLVNVIADEWAPLPGRHERLDDFRALFAFIASSLTELEREALLGVASGETYDEIRDRLPGPRVSLKAIDNAVQRARRKCAPFLADLRDAA